MPPQPHVALFITCLTDQFYPRVGIAVTKILERHGCRVSFPKAQTCCGQPFFNNGFHPEAKALAERFVEIFGDASYDYVVTPSGSCCAMVREQFEQLALNDPKFGAKAHRVVPRTYEFVEFVPGERLVMRTAQGPFPMETTYTWAPAGGGSTRMTLRSRGEPSGFSKLFAPFMSRAMRRANRKDLANLKAILESGSR